MITKLAGCILLDSQNKICLIHRNKKGVTQWELPGGKVEPDEKVETAAIRELEEELGVKVSIQKLVGDTKFEVGDRKFEYIWFLAKIDEGTPKVCEPDTFDDLGFFSFDELEDLELSGNMQQLYGQIKSRNILLP